MRKRRIKKDVICEFEFVSGRDVRITDNPKNDLGMDSLDMMDVLMRLEKKLCISIDEREFKKSFEKSVSDVIHFVELKIYQND